MLTNVNFYNRFWRDNKVKHLSSNGKYLFGYMITSPYNNELGLYYMPLALVAHDTGLTEEIVKAEMASLIENSLIKYDYQNEMVFVINFLRFNNNEKTMSSKEVEAILENLPETYLIKDFLEAVIINNVSYINEETITKWKEEFQPVIRGLNMEVSSVESIIDKNISSEQSQEQNTDTEEKNSVTNKTKDTETIIDKKTSENETIEDVKTDDEEKDIEEEIKRKKSKSKAPTETEKKELGEVFNEIWKMYPKKQNIAGARKNFISLVTKEGVSVVTLKQAVKNYAQYVEEHKVDPAYIIYGSNFFGRSQRYTEYTNEAIAQDEVKLSPKEEEKVRIAFEKFWKIYPKKKGRELAYKNFLYIYANKENTLEELISSAEKYAQDCFVRHEEETFIKVANKFLDLKTRPYRDFIDFTNKSSSITTTPTEDYTAPVINQPIYDSPVPAQDFEDTEEPIPVVTNISTEGSVLPQPLDEEVLEEYPVSTFENQGNETKVSVPLDDTQTFVSDEDEMENVDETETPW